MYHLPAPLPCFLSPLSSLPSHISCDRKINEFVKRVRACKIHMLLIGHMRKQVWI